MSDPSSADTTMTLDQLAKKYPARAGSYLAREQELDDVIATFRPGFHYGVRDNKLILLLPGAERLASYFDLIITVSPVYDDPAYAADSRAIAGEVGLLHSPLIMRAEAHGRWVPDRVAHDNGEDVPADYPRHLADGYGAATLQEFGTPNVAVQMAAKRAYVAAVRRALAISGRFTQDMSWELENDVSTRSEAPDGRTYGARRAE